MADLLDMFRPQTAGNYETDFSFMDTSKQFPPVEVMGRNMLYKYMMRLYSGKYGANKQLTALITNSLGVRTEEEIPYRCMTINYFKLTVSKIIGLMFSNDITVKTGDSVKDKLIYNLIERTGWTKAIVDATRMCQINGDAVIKTYTGGASAFSPSHCFKVVDKYNKKNVIAYVINHTISEKDGTGAEIPKYVRFEIHSKGRIFEQVKTYEGNSRYGTIGVGIEYNYNNRVIPASGQVYSTGVDDCELVQWISLNTIVDGVYGTSPLVDIADIVFALEQRLSSEKWVLDNHDKPYLIVGMTAITNDENTGSYKLKAINGKYLISDGSDHPEYLTWDGKLDNSTKFREDLLSYFYELSEMGKTFLSGEYSGNVSEETLSNTIKSAIDRANRDCFDIWPDIRKSLYTLCKLNNIDIKIEDINIDFNIGRSNDQKQMALLIKDLKSTGLLSDKTILKNYMGYSDEQADLEKVLIQTESGGNNNDTHGNAKQDIRGKVE